VFFLLKKPMKYLVLAFFIISCNLKNENRRFSKTDIGNIADDYQSQYNLKNQTPPPPPGYSVISFFIKTSEHKIIEVNSRVLFDLYKDCYYEEYKSFELFLTEILNKDVIIKSNNELILNKEFNFDKTFFESNKFNLEALINQYLIKKQHSNKEHYTENHKTINKLTENELNTLLYILSKSGYYIIFEDYSGATIISKTLE